MAAGTSTQIPGGILQHLGRLPRGSLGATGPDGAVLIGQGQCSDVWGIGDLAVKLFRVNVRGLDVPTLMANEIATYNAIAARPSPLPLLHDHGVLANGTDDGAACGFAVLERLPGRALGFDDLKALSDGERGRFVAAFVPQAIAMETALKACQPLSSWERSYADLRLERLAQLARTTELVSTADLVTARHLGQVIDELGGPRRFIHGDFNPPNILVQAQGGMLSVRFVDPLINRDVPEANWRHFTLVPNLAEDLAQAYALASGTAVNLRLVHAIGALTHLYMAVLLKGTDVPGEALRRLALGVCLARLV